MLQDLAPLMAAHDVTRAAVPDDRLHEFKLGNRAFQLLPAFVPRPEREPRVVRSRMEFGEGDGLEEDSRGEMFLVLRS
jgi:hypothetical protein